MRRSEIFDSFVKIAQEKGMISNDSSEAKKKLEQTGRADSLDISAIEALYGVKPNTPKDMEYKKNIMEDAHPNSVVISPSYDKLNGLVENNIERQNIILHIVQKTPDGLNTQRKYAQQELTLALVRIANDLDNRDKDELRALADHCLLQVNEKKNLKKTAQDPITLGIAAAVVALFGGLYIKQHMRFISDGFEQDHQKLIGEIDDLLQSNAEWGVGYEYKPDFLQMMQSFKTKLESYYQIYQQIAPAIDALQKPRDAKEIMEEAKKPETVNLVKSYESFKKATDQLLPIILKIQKDFGNEMYKQRQIQDKGFLSSLVDKTQILHGGKGLVADDFDDVRHALETYVLDITNVGKVLASAESFKKALTSEMQEASSKSHQMFSEPPKSAPTESPTGEKTVADIDREAGELSAQLGG